MCCASRIKSPAVSNLTSPVLARGSTEYATSKPVQANNALKAAATGSDRIVQRHTTHQNSVRSILSVSVRQRARCSSRRRAASKAVRCSTFALCHVLCCYGRLVGCECFCFKPFCCFSYCVFRAEGLASWPTGSSGLSLLSEAWPWLGA